ncbi:hypothetical protein SCHPADRAFT_912270 [Schizopora paradoxa]|uniref:Dienelactone hydrolase domain-containing protein n=1 Tax=Schizopora paradoxa TaxID=27342 RepID=A0A0H2SSD8_9AGAM|nr:hypothetical protein SCHPADRAFT_912270 [Schizopora paradoxa]
MSAASAIGAGTGTPAGSRAAVVNANPACCSIPPVLSSNYVPKGKFIKYAGFEKVYVTGPEKSDTAIVSVYDIFGFFPQTEQGADILATTLNAVVYMPDFFEPNEPFPIDKFPPKSDEDKDDLQRFFAGPAKPEKAVDNLIRFGKSLREDGKIKVGAYGMCWGGKVTILAGSGETPVFDAVGALHPAMLSADDANDLSVPLGLFISKDEPIEEYEKMVDKISHKPFAEKNAYKLYPTMFHGWAAARANLDDPENKKQFEDVYARLSTFFTGAFEKNRGGTQASL